MIHALACGIAYLNLFSLGGKWAIISQSKPIYLGVGCEVKVGIYLKKYYYHKKIYKNVWFPRLLHFQESFLKSHTEHKNITFLDNPTYQTSFKNFKILAHPNFHQLENRTLYQNATNLRSVVPRAVYQNWNY